MRTGFTAVGSSDGGRLGAYVLGILAVGAAYYLAARAGLALAYLHGSVTALWPPIGVGIAALTVYGARLWPGILIGDLLAGDFSTPFFTVVGQTAGNVLEVVVAALLLRRLVGGRTALDRTRDVAALLVSAAVGTAISALVGTASLRLGGVITPHEFPEVLRTWWLSDTTGALVVAPVFLTWLCTVPRTVPRREAVEGAIVLAVLVALAEIPSQRDVPYVVFPVLIWAALRLGTRGAATAVVVVAGLTVWNTGHNAGPFVRDSITDSLLSTQLFMAIAALTSLVLAAVTAERARAEQRLVESERAQRTLAAEQAALRRIATVVAGDASAAEIFALVTQEVGRVLGAPTASIIRYDDEHTARIVGVWTDMGAPRLPVGSALSLDGDSVIAKVRRSGSPQRLERYEDAVGSLADTLRTLGHRSAVAAPVRVGGKLWGALAATTMRPEPFPDGYEQRLCDFAELVAQAVSNAEAHDQLAASRARIVEAGDAERRRLERNLHDGAQQRLVSLALHLRLITAKLDSDPQLARELLAKVSVELQQALEELRELARGIHPAILSDRGLGAALEALAMRSPIPVELGQLLDESLPEPVEAAAYYVVAEAVTNVAKYAGASHVTVNVSRENGHAIVEVADDGVGGADATRGSGLRGLSDRVEALQGHLAVESPRDHGTRIRAEIPVRPLTG